MIDDNRESDCEFLARVGTDAQQWAREFLAHGLAHDDVDEGTLLGWFANAIEAGRSAGYAARVDTVADFNRAPK